LDFATKERRHGEEGKKESESEEEKVIVRIGVKLPLTPIRLETLVWTSADGNIQPLFIEAVDRALGPRLSR
jgi:hypothetical protein